MVSGALVMLFVVYQLWGTGLLQAADQRQLKDDVRDQIKESALSAVSEAPRGETSPPDEPTTATVPALQPQLGEAVGIISVPAIGLEQALIEGAGRDELKKGPGHYPHSPLPGHSGNVSIAGHRTTYGAPFFRLDELKPGDEVIVETVQGRFVYTITGSTIVSPDDVSVISATDDNRITLTTCNPKYSARERLIVTGTLRGDPVDAAPAPSNPPPAELASEDVPDARPAEPVQLAAEPRSGLDAMRPSTGLWTGAVLAVGVLWWLLVHRRHTWVAWAAGVLPFLAVLFFFFGEIERLLPTNY